MKRCLLRRGGNSSRPRRPFDRNNLACLIIWTRFIAHQVRARRILAPRGPGPPPAPRGILLGPVSSFR